LPSCCSQPVRQTALNDSVNCRIVSCRISICSTVGLRSIRTVLSTLMLYHLSVRNYNTRKWIAIPLSPEEGSPLAITIMEFLSNHGTHFRLATFSLFYMQTQPVNSIQIGEL